MKFSVIIPVYNCENSLSVSINSILSQTYKDFELIIINDGSKDNSLATCREFEKNDPRIVVIDQPNAGAGPARNNGLSAARGEYVLFCDADDYYEPDALQNIADEAELSHPDLIIGNYREFYYKNNVRTFCNEKREKTHRWVGYENVRKHYIYLRKNSLITAPWTKAYRREVIEQFQVQFPNLRRCQDVVFNLDYYGHCQSVSLIDAILYNYLTPDGNIYLKKFPISMFDIHKTVHSLTIEKLKEWGALTKEAKQYLDAKFLIDASILLRLNYQNNWKLDKKAQNDLSEMILSDPLTKETCQGEKVGIRNQLTQIVLKTGSKRLADLLSFVTITYQQIRRKVK